MTGSRCMYLMLLIGALTLATGCQEQVVQTTWGGYGQTQSPQQAPAQRQSSNSAKAKQEGQWAIALNRLEGPNHAFAAASQVDGLRRLTGMDVWTVDEGTQSVIYSGRYVSSDDPRAQGDLAQWRQLIARRQVQLPAAMLVPIVETTRSTTPEYDLRTVARRDPAKLYTLQIGFYDEEFGPGFRQAAEEAAAILRQEGEEAWYFHGPQRSLITLGAFGEEAVSVQDNGVPLYAQHVESLRQKYPHNLANGRTLNEKRAGGVVTTQESFLVRIPRD